MGLIPLDLEGLEGLALDHRADSRRLKISCEDLLVDLEPVE